MQVYAAKLIWQAIINKQQQEEHLAVMKQRIYVKRLPSAFHILDSSIDHIEKLLAQSALYPDERATFSSQGEKFVAQYKYNMMELTLRTTEAIIRRHEQIIVTQKEKFRETTAGEIHISKSSVCLLNAIAARQSNMIKRAQLVTKHKLSFFDHAPTAAEEQAAGIAAGAVF